MSAPNPEDVAAVARFVSLAARTPSSAAGTEWFGAWLAARDVRAVAHVLEQQAAEVARLTEAFDGLDAEHAAAEGRIRDLVEERDDYLAHLREQVQRTDAAEQELAAIEDAVESSGVVLDNEGALSAKVSLLVTILAGWGESGVFVRARCDKCGRFGAFELPGHIADAWRRDTDRRAAEKAALAPAPPEAAPPSRAAPDAAQ
jgi:hypothetical protein